MREGFLKKLEGGGGQVVKPVCQPRAGIPEKLLDCHFLILGFKFKMEYTVLIKLIQIFCQIGGVRPGTSINTIDVNYPIIFFGICVHSIR